MRLKDGNFALAGDIGGTKTNLGLFQMGKTRPSLRKMETYSSRDAANLEEIISRFLDKHKATIASACFGLAGPVQGKLTWLLDKDAASLLSKEMIREAS